MGVYDADLGLNEMLSDAAEELASGKVMWVLKPSIAAKGAEVTPLFTLSHLKETLNEWEDVKEWVLQKYVHPPLLLRDERKFHLRVFVVCVGDMDVFLYDPILVLFASEKYDAKDASNLYSHLTNAAHQADHPDFDQDTAMMLMHDVFLEEFTGAVSRMTKFVKKKVVATVAELFKATKDQILNYQPMSNGFEVYGLDFLLE